jgi:hypothetical protein
MVIDDVLWSLTLCNEIVKKVKDGKLLPLAQPPMSRGLPIRMRGTKCSADATVSQVFLGETRNVRAGCDRTR